MNYTSAQYDLLIIGGGINGAGIARDAAGRGLSVLLVEQHDLASGTSSRSSKLIHGGLRYLETYQLRLVREALKEREVLLHAAPHLISPLRFVLPHVPSMRPQWMLQAGLWLYDHLAARQTLPASARLNLAQAVEGKPLLPTYTHGFSYADAWVDDARLVVLNAVEAAQKGAVIQTRTKLTRLFAEQGIWCAETQSPQGISTIKARCVINAAGPWVADVAGLADKAHPAPVRLVKGSHLVVPRLYAGDWAYICQNDDGRVVFFTPYEQDFTLIGTTDVPLQGAPEAATCSVEEENYLLGVTAQFFRRAPSTFEVIQRVSGVRALYDNGAKKAQNVSRDYKLEHLTTPAPMVHVYGGKITTYRCLAEQVMAEIAPHFPTLKPAWTKSAILIGGDMGGLSRSAYTAKLSLAYPWLPAPLLARYVRQFGALTPKIIGEATSLRGLGQELRPSFYEAEADYFKTHEFALTDEDMLWRRTKLGLRHI